MESDEADVPVSNDSKENLAETPPLRRYDGDLNRAELSSAAGLVVRIHLFSDCG